MTNETLQKAGFLQDVIKRCESNISLLKMLKEAPNVTLSDRVYVEIVNEVIKAYQQKLEQTKKELADL